MYAEIVERMGKKLSGKTSLLPSLSDAGAPKSEDDVVKDATAISLNNMARCTRRAKDCQAMSECMKGMYLPEPVPKWLQSKEPYDAGPPPPKEPYWKQPVVGDTRDPLNTTPWDGGAEPMPIDSMSCVACTVERCPNFAYFCFGADGDKKNCPNGDCCHSLRRCVRDCGGYHPYVSPVKFYDCLGRCQVNRPSATQQLANLQHCADVACKGCDAFDQKASEESP